MTRPGRQYLTFKIQRPLAVHGRPASLLIYDRNRNHEYELPMEAPGVPDLLELMGDRPKIYVRGRVAEDGNLRVIREVWGRSW